MIEIKIKAKKWGNSVGILLPKKLGIKPDQEINIHLEPARRVTRVKDIFGTVHLKGTVKALMEEIDQELG
jgi:antitoxin component of MazEF toxin-antitoxin module